MLRGNFPLQKYIKIYEGFSYAYEKNGEKNLIKKLKTIGIICPNPEGRPKCDWIIVDAGSVIIHLFRSEIREVYNLEKLWNMTFDSVENNLA